ncbi:MAG: alpha-L-glutamate ligase-like protein [Deltaproteobacteria bacterium]|nr:alpha-L-glutamate ligase-like protein [Deltaproteobacteria bacterium]
MMGFGLIKSVLSASEKVVGLNYRNFELIYKLNERQHYPMADDKIESKEFLKEIGVPTAETYRTYSALFELDDLTDDLSGYPSFVIKPSNGSRGNGILILYQPEKGKYRSTSGRVYPLKDLRYFIASIIFGKFSMGQQDRVLIEKKLTADQSLNEISFGGLADIRVLIAGEKLIQAMLRLPTSGSDGKANLHQGGIGVGVDLASGITTRAIYKDRWITKHPDTQKELTGFQIPHWERMLELSVMIAKNCPMKYIGVDLIIDRDQGPLVIEFNARPGLEIQNANLAGLKDIL